MVGTVVDDELNLQDINSHGLVTSQTFPKAENKWCTHGLYSPPDVHTCRMFVCWTKSLADLGKADPGPAEKSVFKET